jgi:hypothetical protein
MTAIRDIKIVTLIIGITINKTKFVDVEEEEDDNEHWDCKFERLYIPEIFFFELFILNKTLEKCLPS